MFDQLKVARNQQGRVASSSVAAAASGAAANGNYRLTANGDRPRPVPAGKSSNASPHLHSAAPVASSLVASSVAWRPSNGITVTAADTINYLPSSTSPSTSHFSVSSVCLSDEDFSLAKQPHHEEDVGKTIDRISRFSTGSSDAQPSFGKLRRRSLSIDHLKVNSDKAAFTSLSPFGGGVAAVGGGVRGYKQGFIVVDSACYTPPLKRDNAKIDTGRNVNFQTKPQDENYQLSRYCMERSNTMTIAFLLFERNANDGVQFCRSYRIANSATEFAKFFSLGLQHNKLSRKKISSYFSAKNDSFSKQIQNIYYRTYLNFKGMKFCDALLKFYAELPIEGESQYVLNQLTKFVNIFIEQNFAERWRDGEDRSHSKKMADVYNRYGYIILFIVTAIIQKRRDANTKLDSSETTFVALMHNVEEQASATQRLITDEEMHEFYAGALQGDLAHKTDYTLENQWISSMLHASVVEGAAASAGKVLDEDSRLIYKAVITDEAAKNTNQLLLERISVVHTAVQKSSAKILLIFSSVILLAKCKTRDNTEINEAQLAAAFKEFVKSTHQHQLAGNATPPPALRLVCEHVIRLDDPDDRVKCVKYNSIIRGTFQIINKNLFLRLQASTEQEQHEIIDTINRYSNLNRCCNWFRNQNQTSVKESQ